MRRGRLRNVINIDEFEKLARRRLPHAVYDTIAGGATDEVTLRANRTAFEHIWLRPRVLADLSQLDMSTTVLGQKIALPVMLAPTGAARFVSSEAERGIARAAGRTGTIYAVSSAASQTLEEIAEAATEAASGMGSLWYQLYIPPSRAETVEVLDRVRKAGYAVLCVTIDTGVRLRKERDLRNNFTVPIRFSPALVLTGLSRPAWTWEFLFGRVGRVRGGNGQGKFSAKTAVDRLTRVVTNTRMPTWDDIRFIRENWDGSLVLKGIMRGDEVPALVELGVDGLVVSNHGGRNIDSVLPSIEILPEVVRAAAGRVEVYLDGGVRRGTDVVKAVALGARAVFVGRPYLWGAAVAGSAGVEAVLNIFKTEVLSTMEHCGLQTVAAIDSSAIVETPHIATRRFEQS